MSDFLDRQAGRAVGAVGEAPLVHPRVCSRFEPGGGEVVGAEETVKASEEVGRVVVERVAVERAAVERAAVERAAVDQLVGRAAVETLEEVGSQERPMRGSSPPEPMGANFHQPVSIEGHPDARDEGKDLGGRTFPSPRSFRLGTRPQDDFASRSFLPAPDQVLERAVAPPLPGEGSADGRGGRGVRGHAVQSEALHQAGEPRRAEDRVVTPELAPLRPIGREAPAPATAELPTVEGGRGAAPLPEPASEGAEPSETVVQVTIGRIDVRAVPPPALDRRAERPAGPRLSLADYLQRRGERRR